MLASEDKTKPAIKMPLKEVKLEAFKLLGDETRRKIMLLLRDKELNVCAVANELKMTPQTIYHHMKKLEHAGLIQVTCEKRCGHLIESYYQATAENFICCTGKIKGETPQEDFVDALDGLNMIGFKMEANGEVRSKLKDFHQRMVRFTKLLPPVDEIFTKYGATSFLLKSGPVNLLKLKRIYSYGNLVMMTDEEYEKCTKLERRLRQFLRSICREKPKINSGDTG